jgi:hypothetical protein
MWLIRRDFFIRIIIRFVSNVIRGLGKLFSIPNKNNSFRTSKCNILLRVLVYSVRIHHTNHNKFNFFQHALPNFKQSLNEWRLNLQEKPKWVTLLGYSQSSHIHLIIYKALINIKMYLFLLSFKETTHAFSINCHTHHIIWSIYYPFISNSNKLSCLIQFYILVANNSENTDLLIFRFLNVNLSIYRFILY